MSVVDYELESHADSAKNLFWCSVALGSRHALILQVLEPPLVGIQLALQKLHLLGRLGILLFKDGF